MNCMRVTTLAQPVCQHMVDEGFIFPPEGVIFRSTAQSRASGRAGGSRLLKYARDACIICHCVMVDLDNECDQSLTSPPDTLPGREIYYYVPPGPAVMATLFVCHNSCSPTKSTHKHTHTYTHKICKAAQYHYTHSQVHTPHVQQQDSLFEVRRSQVFYNTTITRFALRVCAVVSAFLGRIFMKSQLSHVNVARYIELYERLHPGMRV